MTQRGPREWTPNRIQKILKKLESDTVDTAKAWIEDMRVIGAADVLPDNKLRSWHVTDDPENVLRVLEGKTDLQDFTPWGDICGGLYVSGFPQLWRGRSRRKWDFMKTISPEGSQKLARAILLKLKLDREIGRLTQNEYEHGVQDVEQYWLKLGNWEVLSILSAQPYTIDIQALAKEQGVAEPFEPALVEVIFDGRYLNLTRDVQQESAALAEKYLGVKEDLVETVHLCQTWRMLGWDGAFTKSSMSSYPQLVIWTRERILKFGDWTREA